MAADEKIIFDILTGQNNLSKALGNVGKEVEKVSTSISGLKKRASDSEGPFLSLGGAIKSILPIATALVGAFSFKSAINEAIEAENALNSLANSIDNVGRSTQTSISNLQAYASSIQEATRFGDDLIIANLGLLQSLGNFTEDGLIAANNAALDLSVALGIDLRAATQLIAQSAQGNVKAFNKYGIAIRQGRDDAESFQNTLNALSKFQGRAAKDSNTFGGALDQLKNAFSDLAQAIGEIITQSPEIIDFLKSATFFVAGLTKQLTSLGPSIRSIFTRIKNASFDISATAFTNQFKLANNEIEKSSDNVKKLDSEVKKVSKTLSTVKGPLLFESTNIEAQIRTATQAFDRAFKNPLDILFSDIEPKAISRQVAQGIGEGAAIFGAIVKGQQGAVQLLSQTSAALTTALTGIPAFGETIGAAVSFLSQGPDKVRQIIQEFFTSIPIIIQNIIFSLLEIQKILPTIINDAVIGIIESLPQIFTAIFENFILSGPRFIEAFISNVPRLIASIIRFIPNIIQSFIQTFTENIPLLVSEIARGVADAIKQAIGGIGSGVGDFFGGIGSGISNAVSSVGSFLGFQDGGRIPNIASLRNDGAIAKVNAGEQILNRDLTNDLERFLREGGENTPQQLTVNLVIGERQLASVLLDLNQRGFRLA